MAMQQAMEAMVLYIILKLDTIQLPIMLSLMAMGQQVEA